MESMSTDQLKKPPIGHAERNTPIYDMIRYWGRKPHNLVKLYVEHYTKANDVVLDPFSGCGVVAIESLRSRRKAIYNDLNLYSRFIARTSAIPIDIRQLKKDFNQLMTHVTPRNTKC
jgi:adenine-specific DNA methylase